VRRAAHIDANQPEIVKVLRKSGANVVSLAACGKGIPDLLVQFRSNLYLLEVKNLKGFGKRLTKYQKDFHAAWIVSVVVDEKDALRTIGAIK
jgi:Holliday junction resolvase